MTRTCRLLLALLSVGIAAACGTKSNIQSWSIAVVSLQSPAPADSTEPHVSVRNQQLTLSWLERDGARATLKFAERTADAWSQPRAVASGENFFVNWADVPSVVRLGDHSLAAHWLENSPSGAEEAYDVRVAFSRDDGATWSPAATPHHDGTATEHGFVSLFQATGESGVGLVWLDGRAMQVDGHENPDGNMALRAATFDRDGKQTSEVAIDDRVCECCPTAAAVTSDGPIVAFRNRTANEIRDISVSRFADGRWTDPASVHNDNWNIEACPVNGPALSARGRDVAIAWFTGANDKGQVFAAFSQDAGKTFGAPIAIHDAGAVGRVAINLLGDGSAAVSWIEFADQRSSFRVRRVDPSGARSPSTSIASIGSGRASGFPRMASHGDELLFAWTDTSGQTPRVRTAIAKLTK